MNKGIAVWVVGILIIVTTSIVLLLLFNVLFSNGRVESVQNQVQESSFEKATHGTTEGMGTGNGDRDN